MKHNATITFILISMFIVTQLIGLAVIKAYTSEDLPFGMEPPEVEPEFSLTSIVGAFIIAIFLIFILMKYRAKIILKLWFFIVVLIALSITLTPLLDNFFPSYISYIALAISLPLAFFKIFKRNIIVHNITELLIYPGIAAVFVPILTIWTTIILLLLISAYDIYAVWHSGFMQKMAKFQMNHLKIFAGFFIPYADKKTRKKIKKMKEKYKNSKNKIKNQKIKVNLAILGGGDVVFPLILAGVVFRTLGLLPALLVALFSTFGLLYLFIEAEKGKFYPAMPFITAGSLTGLLVSWLITLI